MYTKVIAEILCYVSFGQRNIKKGRPFVGAHIIGRIFFFLFSLSVSKNTCSIHCFREFPLWKHFSLWKLIRNVAVRDF